MASAATAGTNLLTSAQFREIHKFSWLKKLTAEGKKVTVGPKKSERSWVVFCVHDDTLAMLEGYAEPRQAASHSPEWMVSMQNTLHISHALIPNSHEFEFVVTLSNEVIRFHAMSWEIMQEWVETLRSKLREMKILSPCENVYTKLPEIRLPLLPTRDPTSPLPATPPVPAALVPGVERIAPASAIHISATQMNADVEELNEMAREVTTDDSNSNSTGASSSAELIQTTTAIAVALTSMSNTRTQDLLNMLSDPISAYSDQLNDETFKDHSFHNGESPIPIGEHNSLDDELALSVLRNSGDPSLDSVRFGTCEPNRSSPEQTNNFNAHFQCERLIPRLETLRSLSAGAADISKNIRTDNNNSCRTITAFSSRICNNVTELEIGTKQTNGTQTPLRVPTSSIKSATTNSDDLNTNITIIQVSTSASKERCKDETLPKHQNNADVFQFPEIYKATAETTTQSRTKLETKPFEYKSNVQIIPSNMNNFQVNVSAVANQYSLPVKKDMTSNNFHFENDKITTLHVTGDASNADANAASLYGTCYVPKTKSGTPQLTPKLPKKVILSANASGVTNITVTADIETNNHHELASGSSAVSHEHPYVAFEQNPNTMQTQLHYDKVFLSSSKPIVKDSPTVRSRVILSSTSSLQKDIPLENYPSALQSQNIKATTSKPTATTTTLNSLATCAAATTTTAVTTTSAATTTTPATTTTAVAATCPRLQETTSAANNSNLSVHSDDSSTTHAWFSFPPKQRPIATPPPPLEASLPPLPVRRPILTRGVTEAAITARPSRRDFHLLKFNQARKKNTIEKANKYSAHALTPNNNIETSNTFASAKTPLRPANERPDLLEQRRRSSSTSDAQSQQHNRSINNNEPTSSTSADTQNRGSPSANPSQPVKHMTLREQQIIQLRREIIHPAGVRLKLRRKDCVGSIAWVDAFGAVWVAGWKQKEHPVLYNAMHIGDQLLSIAGIAISSAVETNKIIRNTNTLFVEVLIRRMPFARGYAIRREREGQCLGLIRDGNTSTIVDVVPNSLAARYGLPPKARSCDGTTLTFWVLTEINGRPLNLFFKENEIRDRLNAVGRDISILVQPSDLITKLKKQLKSLRSYKDYLVE